MLVLKLIYISKRGPGQHSPQCWPLYFEVIFYSISVLSQHTNAYALDSFAPDIFCSAIQNRYIQVFAFLFAICLMGRRRIVHYDYYQLFTRWTE